MNNLKASIIKIAKAALNTFKAFPAANACALGFTLITMIRIQLDWPEQEAYNFLFNCLHLGFSVGVFFSLAAIAYTKSRWNDPKKFWTANLLGVLSALMAFLGLYYLGADKTQTAAQFLYVSDIAASRVAVTILVSLIGLIVFAAIPKARSDFARAFFMVEKAFFIALIYGGVMMAGASSVAGAVEVLLYSSMSEKVYMYIGAIVLFLAYTVFVGYFPDFKSQEADERWETTQKQPKFIEVLFLNIMVPLMAALTVVLLAWAVKTMLTGDWPSFIQLSSIAIGYSVSGIWLHIMITHHETSLAKWYKRLYPVAALIVLAFEAWALLVQLSKYGLKTTEYYFVLVWVVTVLAVILLFAIKDRAHMLIAAMVCVSAIISVLPVVGYQILPIQMQIHRLEGLLETNGLLQNGTLVPAKTELPVQLRYAITDSVLFLAYERNTELPMWFDKKLGEIKEFKDKLGFDQLREATGTDVYLANNTMATYLQLPSEPISIKGYDWMVNIQQMERIDNQTSVSIKGGNGTYQIAWTANEPSVPELRIKRDGKTLLTQSLQAYLDKLMDKYPPSMEGPKTATISDMTFTIETPEVSVLLVFNNVNVDLDISRDKLNYWVNLNAVYFKEK